MTNIQPGDYVRHRYDRHLSGDCSSEVSAIDEINQTATVYFFNSTLEGNIQESHVYSFSELELVNKHPDNV